MCAMSFIMYLDRVNLSAAAGLIRDDLHLTNTDVGLVFAAFAYTYAICQVIGGWLSDRFGAKTTLTVCASIWIVATVATGFAGGVVSLFCARMLLGVGEGAALPAQARALDELVSRRASAASCRASRIRSRDSAMRSRRR